MPMRHLGNISSATASNVWWILLFFPFSPNKKNFPLIFLWGRFRLQQVNDVVNRVMRQLSGSCLGMKDEGEWNGGGHARPLSVAPCLSFTPVADTVSFGLWKSLWPRNGTEGETQCAPEQTQQWKTRRLQKLVEPSPSMSHRFACSFSPSLQLPSPPLHPHDSSPCFSPFSVHQTGFPK